MSSAPNVQEIARDARWLVQALDAQAGLVRLVEMDREAYRNASFLDDRMLQQPVDAHLVAWRIVADAAATIARTDARWIFHIGHVGSTLIARMLGELTNVLSVREPRFLRDLAAIPADQRMAYAAAARALLSRTFADDEIALVKATSFVSEIADELIQREARAVFMFAGPRNYIAGILAGENSVKELHLLAASRKARLASRNIEVAQPRHQADLAALAWACEMTALEVAALPDRLIKWLDFDSFLQSPPAELAEVAQFLGFSTNDLEAIASGPLLARYSKAPEYEYSPGLRRDLIADATRRHDSDIHDALALLRSAAETSPLLARALARSGEA
jgi:hypothetical protein